jgi:hypothetical protein
LRELLTGCKARAACGNPYFTSNFAVGTVLAGAGDLGAGRLFGFAQSVKIEPGLGFI